MNTVEVQALKLQGFTRMVTPEERDIRHELKGAMAEAGTQVVAADRVQQFPWRCVPFPEFSLVSILPYVFDAAGVDDEGENGGEQEEAVEAEI
jgi:hypothetical protein